VGLSLSIGFALAILKYLDRLLDPQTPKMP